MNSFVRCLARLFEATEVEIRSAFDIEHSMWVNSNTELAKIQAVHNLVTVEGIGLTMDHINAQRFARGHDKIWRFGKHLNRPSVTLKEPTACELRRGEQSWVWVLVEHVEDPHQCAFDHHHYKPCPGWHFKAMGRSSRFPHARLKVSSREAALLAIFPHQGLECR
jgi:hypothetical protein